MSQSTQDESTEASTTSNETISNKTVEPIQQKDQIFEDVGDPSPKQHEAIFDLSPSQLLLNKSTSKVALTECEFPITNQEEQSTGIVSKLEDLAGKALLEHDRVKDTKSSSILEECPVLFANATNMLLQQKLMPRELTSSMGKCEIETNQNEANMISASSSIEKIGDISLQQDVEPLNESDERDSKQHDEEIARCKNVIKGSMKSLDEVESSVIQTIEKVDTSASNKSSTSAKHIYTRERKFGTNPTVVPPQEMIFIVLDRARNEKITNENKMTSLTMMKNSLTIFLKHKTALDSRHEYGIITMNTNTSTWLYGMSDNIESLIKLLDSVDECPTEDNFDLNTIFDLILKKVDICKLENSDVPPKYIVRVFVMYGRSATIPVIKMTNEIRNLMKSQFFTFDVAVIDQDYPDCANTCEKIIKCFSELSESDCFVSLCRNSYKLYMALAKLFEHPLRHSPQKK